MFAGFVIGIASDIALWFWLTGGALVDGLARARHGYTEEIFLDDIQPRFWYGMVFAAVMTLIGAILVIRRITSVGAPLLAFAIAGLTAVLCAFGYMMTL